MSGRSLLRFRDGKADLFGVAQALLPLLRTPRDAPWVIMVNGLEGGEGATTVARNLADVAAREFAAPVCLVRITDDEPGADAIPVNGAGAAPAIRRAPLQSDDPGTGEVLLVEISRRALAAAADGGALRENLRRVSQYAGFFLIDGPPVLRSLDAARLCAEVDGLILVAEAERTSPADVQSAREAVESFGGRIIGGVLNKRRRRLPGFLISALGGGFRPRFGGRRPVNDGD